MKQKIIKLVLVLVMLITVLATPTKEAKAVEQEFDSYTNNITNGYMWSDYFYGQTFSPALNYYATGAELYVTAKVGGMTANITLRTTTGGYPDAGAGGLLTQGVLSAVGVHNEGFIWIEPTANSTWGWYRIDFDDVVLLSANVTYAITMERNSGSGGTGVYWNGNNSGFSDGQRYRDDTAATPWAVDVTTTAIWDMNFKIFGMENSDAVLEVFAYDEQDTAFGANIWYYARSNNSTAIYSHGIQMGVTTGNYTVSSEANRYAFTNAANTRKSGMVLFPTANLTIGQEYFYRAYANNGDFGYTAEKSFTFNPPTGSINLHDEVLIQLGTADNFSASWRADIAPAYIGNNMTGHLGTTPSGYELDSSVTGSQTYAGTWQFETTDWPITANTTYYYQVEATYNGTTYWSLIKWFIPTPAPVTPPKPSVIITGITNITSLYDWIDESADNVAIELEARIVSGNVSGVFYSGFDLALTENGALIGQPTTTIVNTVDITPAGTFSKVVFLSGHAWYDIENIVYIQAFAANDDGKGVSTIQSYIHSTEISGGDSGAGVTSPLEPFSETVKGVRIGLGLGGEMGTWALMFIILAIVALLFGTPMFVLKDTARTAVGIIWAMLSICVLGGFIFTGALGVWPILILVGVVVAIVIIFISTKVSGSNGGM